MLILEQTRLPAGHGEIDVGQNLGVEQRAVQRATGIVHAVALAQRIEVVLLPRCIVRASFSVSTMVQ